MHRLATATLLTLLSTPAFAQLAGQINSHDPSTLIKDGSTYYYFATGTGIVSRSSTDLINWSSGPSVFATPPAWVAPAVPGFTDQFWAPDVVFRNNQYYLYYSVSTFGSQRSGIGVAVNPTLNPAAANYGFVDRGPVITSVPGSAYNTIDPSILNDANGRMWMTFGSYWNGIYATELNPSTGLRLNPSVAPTRIAYNSSIEASALIQHGSYYYLFVDYGQCCSGVDSTYEIRVGRSSSPTGPFLDKNGMNMVAGGGSIFLDDDGAKIGPGHFSLDTYAGQEQYGFHYYDGNRGGASTYGRDTLYWTADAWPSVAPKNPDWTGAATANWSDAANWSGGIVPDGVGSIANFVSAGSGRRTITVDGPARTLSRINFATASTYTVGTPGGNAIYLQPMSGDAQATINVQSGTHAIAAPLIVTGDLGVNVVLALSTLSLQGGVSGRTFAKYGDGAVTLAGTNDFTGSISIRNGSVTIDGTAQAAQFTSVGQSAGDVATLSVRNGGALVVSSDLNIGDTGSSSAAATGTLNIQNGASVTVNAAGGFFVGSGFTANTRANGTVNQSGGTLTADGNFDGAFVIGGRNSSAGVGVYNLSGGTVNANTNVFVGGRGTGSLVQTGGVFNGNAFLSIGRYAGSSGSWTLTNGEIRQSDPAKLLIVGESGVGVLNVGSGGLVSTGNTLRLGHATGGSGTVNLDTGGAIAAPSVSRGAGAAMLNLNGGTLRATADAADFIQLAPSEVEVLGGGLIIDTNGHSVTLARQLDGPGGLTKVGGGTLSFATAQSFRGGITVSTGTLRAPRFSGNGGLTISGGAVELASPTTPFDPAQLSVVDFLNLSGGSLDIHSNLFAIDYTAATPSPAAAVRTMLHDGTLIASGTSSTTTIGYADTASLTAVPGAFGGVDSSAVIIRATHAGDATLNGTVDFDDLVALAQNYNLTNRFWSNGDFNYDGIVDFDDLVILAQNYNASDFTGDWALAQSIAVPEPVTATSVFGLALLLMRRRPPKAARQVSATHPG